MEGALIALLLICLAFGSFYAVNAGRGKRKPPANQNWFKPLRGAGAGEVVDQHATPASPTWVPPTTSSPGQLFSAGAVTKPRGARCYMSGMPVENCNCPLHESK